jgi:two-component system sensor histidine kinase RegB
MGTVVQRAFGYQKPAIRRQLGRVRVRTLIGLRWFAVAGQTAAVAIVHWGLGYPLPVAACLVTISALALVTLGAQLSHHSADRLSDREGASYLGFDIVQLAVILYLTGGTHNPFSILLLAPTTVAAAVLSYRSTAALVALASGSVIFLSFNYRPLPWPDSRIQIPDDLMLGAVIAIVTAIVFVSFYVLRVAEESRRLSDALAAAQATLDREQRASSLGALAAAAAHELGSPLGTIFLVAKEMAKEMDSKDPRRSDIDLLVSQSTRCREILAELSAIPSRDNDHFNMLPAKLLVELAAEPYRRQGVVLVVDLVPNPAEPSPPLLPRRPEIMHGLGNLLQNASEFAAEEVRAAIAWNDREIAITISDDGPGFPEELLDRLGDPYVSSQNMTEQGGRDGDHMGLGVFIAQNLIERTGGRVSFSNLPQGGASVEIHWPRDAFERKGRVSEGVVAP